MHDASFLQIMKAPSGNLLFTRKDPILLIIIGKQKTLLSTELKVRSFRAEYNASCLRCPIKNRVGEILSQRVITGRPLAIVAFSSDKIMASDCAQIRVRNPI